MPIYVDADRRPFTLYGVAASLYTGKVRAYLRKQRLDYHELAPSHPRYQQEILPRIHRFIMPVLETPDGEVVQDGTDIIDWLEARGLARLPAYPTTPRHRVVALIFELFGGEGLLRPAMHYRWNFPEANDAFLRQQFGAFIAPGAPRAVRDDVAESPMHRMRQAARAFGVTPETAAMVEAVYLDFLDAFEAHLNVAPYLLGGRPSIGDYGLFAALHAHLARDPHPSMLMKRRAPMVFRWTERMHSPEPDLFDFPDYPEAFFSDDAIPDSLAAVLRLVAGDYLPEVRAFVAFTNQWLIEHPEARAGVPVGRKPSDRGIGFCQFAVRGTPVTAAVLPYRLTLLQRIQKAAAALDGAAAASVAELLEGVGLADLLRLRTTRPVERRDHLEVWGS